MKISELEKIVQVKIAKIEPINGGCINNCFMIIKSNGEKLFVKHNTNQYKHMFNAESNGLKALKTITGPRVPTVHTIHEDDKNQYIIMEFIKSMPRSEYFWENFAQSLSNLHKNKSSDFYGFTENNFIGSTVQINKQEKSWIKFFTIHRIGFQVELIFKKNHDLMFLKLSEKFIKKLENLLIEPSFPSILHGDLWSGNVITDENGNAVLIDPAVYFGHYEADLAMTELFGGFNSTFYREYNNHLPLDSGYSERKEIYNLYHLLNHYNIFGGSYLNSCVNIMKKYI